MKYARELITARLTALEEVKHLREEKKQEYYKDTIDFCEDYINTILVEEAKKATLKNTIEVQIFFAITKDEFENDCICLLKPYENCPFCHFMYGSSLDKKVMDAYLRKHHYKTKWEKATYFTYHGLKEEAISLTISIKMP